MKLHGIDLTNGMLVLNSRDELGIVIGDAVVYYSLGGAPISSTLDMRAIYSAPTSAAGAGMEHWLKKKNFIQNSRTGVELLWEYKEPVEELTLKQICKELGREVKIIK